MTSIARLRTITANIWTTGNSPETEFIAQRRSKAKEMVLCIAVFVASCVSMTSADANAAAPAETASLPTAESALAVDEELARAIRENNADEIRRLLDDSWAVISTAGGVGEGPSVFPNGIKSGALTRKTFELSEARVRLYGDTALVTSKVKTSGTFRGKPFEVTERQTDVLYWKNGVWKCILTHETKIQNN